MAPYHEGELAGLFASTPTSRCHPEGRRNLMDDRWTPKREMPHAGIRSADEMTIRFRKARLCRSDSVKSRLRHRPRPLAYFGLKSQPF